MWPRRYTHKIERDVVRAMRPWRRGWYLASSARRRSRLSTAIQVLSPHELQPEPCYLPLPCWSPSTVTLRVLQPAGAAHFPEHMWVRPARRVFWFLWCGRAGRSAFVFADPRPALRGNTHMYPPHVCDASTPDAIAWCIALRWMPGLRRLLIRYEGHFSDGTLSRRRFPTDGIF